MPKKITNTKTPMPKEITDEEEVLPKGDEESTDLEDESNDSEDETADESESEEDEEVPEKLRSSESVDESSEGKTPEGDGDYLRQYQYKKVNNVPVLGSVGGKLTDPDKGSKAERMKQYLLSEKRVSILIPLPEGSSPKVLHSVCLNGYRLDFPTNTYIDVPMQIAEVIKQSNNQTVAALNFMKIDGDKGKEDNLK